LSVASGEQKRELMRPILDPFPACCLRPEVLPARRSASVAAKFQPPTASTAWQFEAGNRRSYALAGRTGFIGCSR